MNTNNKWENININNFSGSIELLWELAKHNKIDILNIDLFDITSQYVDYIQKQKELNVEIASEYLIFMVKLVELKLNKILKDANQTYDENVLNDTYEEILYKLTEFDNIKKQSEKLYNNQSYYYSTFSKEKTDLKFLLKEHKKYYNLLDDFEENNIDISDFDFDDIRDAYKNILVAYNFNKYRQNQLNFDDYLDDLETATVETNIISPNIIKKNCIEKMILNKNNKWEIIKLLDNEYKNLNNFITLMISVLDLVKQQVLKINQDKDNKIYIWFNDEIKNNNYDLNKILEIQNDN